MATVRELVTRFGFQVDQTGVNRVEGSINRLSGMLQGLAAFASLRALAGVADSMQSLEARIGMLPQTIGDVGDAFNEVSRRASASRQGIKEYGSLYVRLAGATKEYLTSQEDVLQVTDAISNALVIGGAVASEQASAMLQLSQGFQKGKLDGDEFKSFMETMSTDFKEKLAVQLDTTADKLYDLSSSGQLTAKKLALAFKAMAPEIERQLLKMPLTIGQATTIIGNKFSTMVGNLNRESKVVTNVANFLLNGFDNISNALKSFVEAVGGSGNAIKLLMIVAGVLFAMWIPGWYASAAAVLAATWPILAIVAALTLVGLLFEDFLGWLDGSDSMLGRNIGSVEKWRNEINNVKAAFNGLMSVVSVLWRYVLKPFLDAGFETFIASIQVVGMIFSGILKTVSLIVEGIKSVGNFIGNMDVASAMQSPGAKVNPSAFGGFATGGGSTNVNSTQVINLTVPPGTPESQQAFLKNAAGAAMSEGQDKKMARDMASGGW